jgi:hypothetical protein
MRISSQCEAARGVKKDHRFSGKCFQTALSGRITLTLSFAKTFLGREAKRAMRHGVVWQCNRAARLDTPDNRDKAELVSIPLVIGTCPIAKSHHFTHFQRFCRADTLNGLLCGGVAWLSGRLYERMQYTHHTNQSIYEGMY